MAERHEELSRLLATPEAVSNQERFKRYSIEYAQLSPLATTERQYRKAVAEYAAAAALADDPEFRDLAAEELRAIQVRIAALDAELLALLAPRDPRDDSNVFLEIRAGTGGDEARS